MMNASLPHLVVFGLDYVLWTFVTDSDAVPPFRKNARNNKIFGADETELTYFKEVPDILEALTKQGIQIGIASSCNSSSSAADLLLLFGFAKYISYAEVYSRPNTCILDHFEKIHEKSAIPYTEMLFFDRIWELESVDRVLGVVGYEVPEEGLNRNTLHEGLEKFIKLKEEYLKANPPGAQQLTTSSHIPVPKTSLPQLVVFGLSRNLWPFFVDLNVSAWNQIRKGRYFDAAPRKPFRRNARDNRVFDAEGVEVKCSKQVVNILETLVKEGMSIGITLGTEDRSIVADLLTVFDFDKYISHVGIHKSTFKIDHLEKIQETSGISFAEVLFFDNEPYTNHILSRVDRILGVVRYEVPSKGLTMGTVRAGLRKFARAKRNQLTSPSTSIQRLKLHGEVDAATASARFTTVGGRPWRVTLGMPKQPRGVEFSD